MNKSIRKSATVKKANHTSTPAKSAKRSKSSTRTIGLDVGDRYTHCCVLDHDGNIESEGRVRTTPEAMSQYLSTTRPARMALESGTHSGWISRLGTQCGHHMIVANPRELRKIHQSNRKNDRADAQMLARMARFDPQLLCPVRHRSADMQADVATLRARDSVVTARTKLINATRGLVKAMGGRIPRCDAGSFARKALEHIPTELHEALTPLLATIGTMTQQIHAYDHSIETLAERKYPKTTTLRQIAGVGPLVSLAFILTIAEPGRFARNRDVGAYLGLVPRQDDSGDRVSQLPITKAGDAYLRRLLVGSAHYILGPFGPDCTLRRYGERLAQRGGKNAKKRAVVAVARKLAVLLLHLWSSGEVYDPLRLPQSTIRPAA